MPIQTTEVIEVEREPVRRAEVVEVREERPRQEVFQEKVIVERRSPYRERSPERMAVVTEAPMRTEQAHCILEGGHLMGTSAGHSELHATTTAHAAPLYSAQSYAIPAGFPTIPANKECRKCQGTGYRRSKKRNMAFVGCKPCAQEYGTDLTQIIIPETTSAMGYGAGATTII